SAILLHPIFVVRFAASTLVSAFSESASPTRGSFTPSLIDVDERHDRNSCSQKCRSLAVWTQWPLLPGDVLSARLGRLRVQVQVAGQKVRVQAIGTRSVPLERAEQAFLRDLKCRGVDVAGPERRVHFVVVVGASDVDAHIAGPQLNVLVAAD